MECSDGVNLLQRSILEISPETEEINAKRKQKNKSVNPFQLHEHVAPKMVKTSVDLYNTHSLQRVCIVV